MGLHFVDMQPPDLETRIAILQMKAEEQKTVVSPEVLNSIARRIQKNIRELEGALNRVLAYARLTQSPLTVELATQALADISSDSHKRTLTPQVIINAVATFFNIPPDTLQGKRRDKNSSQARR